MKKEQTQEENERLFVKLFLKKYASLNENEVKMRGYDSEERRRDLKELRKIKDPEKYYNTCADCKHMKGTLSYPSTMKCKESIQIAEDLDPLQGKRRTVSMRYCKEVRGRMGNYTTRINPICEYWEEKFSLIKVFKDSITSAKQIKIKEKPKVEKPDVAETPEHIEETEPKDNWLSRIIDSWKSQ